MSTVFETIKDRLPITDVLSTYITLTPAGGQFKAKCPFHNERSASFSVSPDRGLYYCFGCGAKGDIFTFVEQFEGVDRKGALKILADRAGVVLTRTTEHRESADPLYDILEDTTLRYQDELMKNAVVQEYLAKRGITAETIKSFRIGYAPDEWHFVSTNSLSKDQMAFAERAGLVKKTEKGYYDRFRKRIMFPLADASGRIVGFSGRLFPEDKEAGDDKAPKYLNSPETEVFQKSRILYCFDKAKTTIRQAGFAILVEGQMDALLAHQNGFRNTVATSGTAVSETMAEDMTSNLSVIARLTPHLFLAFDGDRAGQKALDRAALVALTLGMNPKVVPLPEGIDPADFLLKEGKDKWKELLQHSKHFIIHELNILHGKALSPHVLVQSIKERLFPFLSRVMSPVEQKLYIEAIAKDINVSADEVLKELALFVSKTPVQSSAVTAPESKRESDDITIPQRFIALAKRFPSDTTTREESSLQTLAFDLEKFVFPEIDEQKLSLAMATIERDYATLDSADRDKLAIELAAKIRDMFYSAVRSKYTQELAAAERASDDAQTSILLGKLQELNRSRHIHQSGSD